MLFFFSSRRRHTRYWRDWSSDVCSSDLVEVYVAGVGAKEADVAGSIVLRVPSVFADRHLVEEPCLTDILHPARDLLGTGEPFVVFGSDDLRRLSLVDLLGRLEESFTLVAVHVPVPEQGDRSSGPERPGDLPVGAGPI